MAERALNELRARTKALLTSGDYSDLIITCGTDVYNVHKAIVCLQSSFFKKAESFPMGKEAADGKIDLPEDNPDAMKALVQYFYEGEYGSEFLRFTFAATAVMNPNYLYNFPHTCASGSTLPRCLICPHHICHDETSDIRFVNFMCTQCTTYQALEDDADQFLLHAMMYELADKYDVVGLKLMAKVKFSCSCEYLWDTEYFATAAEHVLTTTPDSDTGLRLLLCQTIVAHIELLDRPPIAALLSKHTGFAYGVLRQYAAKSGCLPPRAETTS